MSDLTVATHFGDVSELAQGFVDRVDEQRLILYGPDAFDEGAEVSFAILLADGSPALEGSGRVTASIDGGEERTPETRYDIVIDAVEVGGMSEVVFERMLMAREGGGDSGPATGEVSLDELEEASASDVSMPEGPGAADDEDEERAWAEARAAAEEREGDEGAAGGWEPAGWDPASSGEGGGDPGDWAAAPQEASAATRGAEPSASEAPAHEAAPDAHAEEPAGPIEDEAGEAHLADAYEGASGWDQDEQTMAQPSPEEPAFASPQEPAFGELGAEDAALSAGASARPASEPPPDSMPPASEPPYDPGGTREVGLADVEDVEDIQGGTEGIAPVMGHSVTVPPSRPPPEPPGAPGQFAVTALGTNGSTLQRPSMQPAWLPEAAPAPELAPASGLFDFPPGSLPLPERPPRPDLDPAYRVDRAPRPEPGAAAPAAAVPRAEPSPSFETEAEAAADAGAETVADEAVGYDTIAQDAAEPAETHADAFRDAQTMVAQDEGIETADDFVQSIPPEAAESLPPEALTGEDVEEAEPGAEGAPVSADTVRGGEWPDDEETPS